MTGAWRHCMAGLAMAPKKSGPCLTEDEHLARGWARLNLRLPPRESAILAALRRPDEQPGLTVRRLIREAAEGRGMRGNTGGCGGSVE